MTTEAEAPAIMSWVPSDDTFGARLAMIRHTKRWNIKQAARACGVPEQTWRQWELDGMEPHRRVVTGKQIATAAGCDYLWLVHGPDRGGASLTRGLAAQTARLLATAGAGARRPHGPVRRTRPIAGASSRPMTPVAI